MRRTVFLITLLVALSLTASAGFTDMPDNWSTAALQTAVDHGLMEGDGGKIYPQRALTRAELATVIVRALCVDRSADLDGFTDVSERDWFYTPMSKAVAAGIFKGDGKTLRPNDPVTREEAFTVIARALCLQTDATSLSSFKDGDRASLWSVGCIDALVKRGYVNGSNGYLYPSNSITRAEFAQIMYNISPVYADGDMSRDIEGTVIARRGVTLSNMTVDGDVIVTSSAVSFLKVTVKGRVIFISGDGSRLDGSFDEVVLLGEGIKVTASPDTRILRQNVGNGSAILFEKKSDTVTEKPKEPEICDDDGKWSEWYD